MTEQDIQIQTLYEALKAAACYIERLEMVQQRRKVRDMTEAMEHYHRIGPALIAAHERS
jgi:pyruvate/2-oxoacid:ferredoxin oxidoreductase beta subunit